MKKIDKKSVFIGFIAGILSVSTVFAGSSLIVKPLKTQLKMNNCEIELSEPLLSIQKSSKEKAVLYAPLDDVMAFMNIELLPSKDGKTIVLEMNNMQTQNGNSSKNPNFEYTSKELKSMKQSDVDDLAYEIMQKTGNWDYIEQFLPYMSKKGIKNVTKLYNSKHPNQSEHK